MANLQLYTLAYVVINGKLLTEEASVTVNRSTGSQSVMTVAKGYAGESPGAATIEVQVSNAVPAADFELNPGQFMQNLSQCDIGIVGPAGKQLLFKGFIISDTFKHSVNSESTLDFTARGGFVDWQ